MNAVAAPGSSEGRTPGRAVLGAEAGLWIGILGLALILRVVRLGDPPLTPDEAQWALEGWRLWHDGRVSYTAGPLLPNLLSLVFGLFTTGDGQARLVSAVAGTGLVVLPVFVRGAVGPRAALCMAGVLAASPPLVVASRTVSPAIVTAALVLLSVVGGWAFVERRCTAWLAAVLSGAAVGLGTDASFTVAIAGLVLATLIAEGESIARPDLRHALRAHGAAAAAVAVLIAFCADTRLMLNPSGVQAGAIDPLWRWIGDVARGTGLVTPILLLLVEGGTLVLAAIGLADYGRHPRLVRLLAIWLVVSVALASLMRQPDLRYLLQPFLPAALLGGLGLRRVFDVVQAHRTVHAALLGLAMLVPLIAAGLRINVGVRSGQDAWGTPALLAALGLLLVAIVMLRTLSR